MGFKVLARLLPGEFAKHLRGKFDDSNFDLVLLDDSKVDEWPSIFASHKPVAVVNYSDNDDFTYESVRLQAIANACADHDIPFLYISSFRVFGPCNDNDELVETHAVLESSSNTWQQKEQICSALSKHVILRMSWMLGGELEDVLSAFVPLLLDNQPVHVSDHNFGRPVHIKYLASAVLAMVQQIHCGAENWGVFHLHASDKCSEAEFCDTLVRILNADFDMGVEMPLVAALNDDRRAMNGSANLAGNRLTRNFGIQRSSWRKGLKAAVGRTLKQMGKIT